MRRPFSRATRERAPTRRRRRVLVMLAVAAPVAALLTTGWFGYGWYGAAHDESIDAAQIRHTVLGQAEQVAINLNTLHHQRPKHGVRLWLESTTGALHKELSSNKQHYTKIIKEGRVDTKAKVRLSAVQSLDTAEHTAVVLVGVDVTATPVDGKSNLNRLRLKLTMTRTSQGWKASRVQAIQT